MVTSLEGWKSILVILIRSIRGIDQRRPQGKQLRRSVQCVRCAQCDDVCSPEEMMRSFPSRSLTQFSQSLSVNGTSSDHSGDTGYPCDLGSVKWCGMWDRGDWLTLRDLVLPFLDVDWGEIINSASFCMVPIARHFMGEDGSVRWPLLLLCGRAASKLQKKCTVVRKSFH